MTLPISTQAPLLSSMSILSSTRSISLLNYLQSAQGTTKQDNNDGGDIGHNQVKSVGGDQDFKTKSSILDHPIDSRWEITKIPQEIIAPFDYTWKQGGKRVRLLLAVVVGKMYGVKWDSSSEITVQTQTEDSYENNLQTKGYQSDQQLKHPLFGQIKLADLSILTGGLIEMLHCASLIIDDIEDNSSHRRGKPCAYKQYGLSLALNAGNLMYFLPFKRLTALIPPIHLCKAYQTFLEEMVACHIGQGEDIAVHHINRAQDLPNQGDYLQFTKYKTGALLRMMVRLLSLFLAIPAQQESQLLLIMENVAISFQITDDLLNLSEDLGKGRRCQDLEQRKFTLIIDRLRHNRLFIETFMHHQKTQDDIVEMLECIKTSGVLDEVRLEAQKYGEAAKKGIQSLKVVDVRAREELLALVRFILERKG